jgi:hypothetical protein
LRHALCAMRYSDFYVDNLLRKAKIASLSAHFHSHRWLDFLKGGDGLMPFWSVCRRVPADRMPTHTQVKGEWGNAECSGQIERIV